MTRTEQRRLLRNFINAVRDHLLERSKDWPEEWDGHDLRELVASAFEWERTPIMSKAPRRRRQTQNEIAVRNLY